MLSINFIKKRPISIYDFGLWLYKKTKNIFEKKKGKNGQYLQTRK